MTSARVFVDAKIIGRHDPKLPKITFVGYLVDGTDEQNAIRVDAGESDDAEVQAILFAVKELSPRYDELTIICDHHSVVSEATRSKVKKPSPLMATLRDVLAHSDRKIGLIALEANRAHGVVTKFANDNAKVGDGQSA